MKRANKRLDFQFKMLPETKDASGECLIEGYANTNSKDRVGDVVIPAAFEKSLETYLKNPVLLLNHDWNDVIGVCTSAEITDKGLYIKGKISNTREDIKTLIKEGCYRTFSIGYNELDADYDESTKTKYIKDLELLEISVVSVPANTEAMFTQIEAKTETEEKPEKKDEEKKAKQAKDLKAFISTIKSVVGSDLDEKSLFAVIDYFNANGDIMTKEQLIEALKVKTLPAPKQDEAKADAAPAQEQQAPAGDELLKAIAAKLDALAEAMVQVMEKLGKEETQETPEEKPKDEEAEKTDESKEEESKEDAAKAGEEEKGDEEQQDAEKEDEMMEEDEEEKELSDADIEKELAGIQAQINDLDEVING